MSRHEIFGVPAPRWFNIPAHRPFAEDLARGLYEALIPEGAEALADAVVLTPTRRGARALTDAFLAAAGGPCCRRRSCRWAISTRGSRRSSRGTSPSTCPPPSTPCAAASS